MKLQAELKNEKFDIDIKRDGEKVFARVNDREYELEASEVEPDVFLLKYNNRISQIYVAPNGIVNLNNHQLEVRVIDPKKIRSKGSGDETADGVVEIKTAMPGKIVRILVEEGAEVVHGQGIIVVEAMKMQNEMRSPKDGIVKSIRHQEGVNVNAGEVLVVIE